MKVTSFPIADRKLFVLEVGRTYGNLKLLQELRLVLKQIINWNINIHIHIYIYIYHWKVSVQDQNYEII